MKYDVCIAKGAGMIVSPPLKQFKIFAKDIHDFAKVKQFFYCGNDGDQGETWFEDFATFVRFILNLNSD